MRRDGRVVDGGGLENHCTRKGTGGSNPSPSARSLRKTSIRQPERGQVRVDVLAIVRFLSVSFLPSVHSAFFRTSTFVSVGSFFTYAARRSTPARRSLSLTMLYR